MSRVAKERVGQHTEKKQTKRQKKVFTNPTLLALFPPYLFIWHLRVGAHTIINPKIFIKSQRQIICGSNFYGSDVT